MPSLAHGHPTQADVPGRGRVEGVRDGLLVVPGPVTDVRELLASAGRTVLIVPPGTATPTPAAPVLLGAGPATAPEVVELAFDEAAARRVPLWAVRVWYELGVDLGRPLPRYLERWDAAFERARAALAAQLAPAVAAHPEVDVRSMVLNDARAAALLALSTRAQLVVLGAPASGSLAGTGPSPVTALARRASCPVAIVLPARKEQP